LLKAFGLDADDSPETDYGNFTAVNEATEGREGYVDARGALLKG
jgi:hypothetical protein